MSVKKNYIYNVTYQILNILIPLVTIPYISRVLGADGIGTVSYAESVVAYFTLFASMGISIYGQREISYVQDSKTERSRIFWETKLLSSTTVSIALLAYLVFWCNQEDKLLYGILALNIFAVLADVSWFFQGMEEFKKTVTRSLLFRILNLFYLFTFVKTRGNVVNYAFALAFFTFAGNVTLWWDIRNYIEKPIWSELKPFRNLKEVISLFIPTVAIQIYTVLDKTMIGMITNDSYENGYYELAIRMSKLVLVVVTSLGMVMVPRVGQYFQKQEHERIKELMYNSYRFVWFLGMPLTFGLIAVSENFVPWFFGGGYLPVISLLKLLAFLILAIGISNVTGIQYLVPTKRQHLLTYSVVIGAVINFCMNLTLIPRFGATGAAVASLTAEVIISVVQLYYVRKELSIKSILESASKYFVAAGIMLLLLYVENKYLSPNLISITTMVLSGAVIYFGVLYILKDEFLREGVSKISIMMEKIISKYLSMGENLNKYKNKVNILFYVTYSLYYFRLFLSTTTFDLPWTIWLYRASLPLVAIIAAYRLLTVRKDDWKGVLVVVLLIGSSFINGVLYGDISVFVFSMFILAAKDTEFKRIVRISVGIGTFIMLLAYLAARSGSIIDYIYYIYVQGEIVGSLHSWGIIYTTDCMAHVFYLVLGYLYLFNGKLGMWKGVGILVLDYYLYQTTGALTSFICIILAVVCSWIYQIWKMADIRERFIEKLTTWLMKFSFILGAVCMLGCTYFYDPKNMILEKINILITKRLQLGKLGFDRYGVHILGRLVEMNGSANGGLKSGEYFYLDSSYINILLRLGILIFLLVLSICLIINKKLQVNYGYALLLMALIALQSMIEHHLLEGAYNFFLCLLLAHVRQISANDQYN